MNRIRVNELSLNSKLATRDVELQFCHEKIANEKRISKVYKYMVKLRSKKRKTKKEDLKDCFNTSSS